jgi:hypothetical protein
MEITKKQQDHFLAAIKNTLNTHAFFSECLHEDFVHYFKGYGGCQSVCRVHIFCTPDCNVVVFEDMGRATGTSITNASEQLANEILRLKHLNPAQTSWLECYPKYEKNFRFDLITYTYDPVTNLYSKPKWSHCPNEAATDRLRKYITL